MTTKNSIHLAAEAIDICRQFDRSQVAIRIRCHPSVFNVVRDAYLFGDAPNHLESLQIIADVRMWPRCCEIEYADGSKALFTPFGCMRKPPPPKHTQSPPGNARVGREDSDGVLSKEATT